MEISSFTQFGGLYHQQAEIPARYLMHSPPCVKLKTVFPYADTILSEDGVNISKGQNQLLTIARRLSAIQNADFILAVNQGEVHEQGSHEELMRLKGFIISFIRHDLND